MTEHPLKILEQLDPELLDVVQKNRDSAFEEGAIPRKFKFLMAMALDASHGTVEGVKSLTQAALNAGATKKEIMETLRVAHYISGVGSVYTAAHAFRELF